MIFKREKEIILNCYTDRPDVYNYFPIIPAIKSVPSWFKQVPNSFFNTPEDQDHTLKSCVGFIDYYKKGFVLPLWSDLFLGIGATGTTNYRWQYSDNISGIETHCSNQWGNYFKEEEYQHIKLLSPWYFTCDENIEFVAVAPSWYFDKFKDINIMSGVINFKYQIGTHVNMFCTRKKEDTDIILRSGTPLYHFIPLTEKKLKIVHHLVSKETLSRIRTQSSHTTFCNSYRKNNKLLSCPFKFDIDK
jgi:hypothetical protein